jgi:hypothetical protein
MTTTTQPQTSVPAAAMQSLDPDAVSALSALKAACKACEDADNEQAKKGAEKADDKYDGPCSDDAKQRFLAQGKAIVDDMWAKFNALQNGYQTSLRPHENVGPRLHQVYTDTWVAVGLKIAPIVTDVQTRGKQDHWTGAGADDYMKQLPVQLSALNELSQYVSVAGAGVETPAQLQQAVFTSFVTMAHGAGQQVRGYAGTETGDHYFQRCAWAASTLGQCVDWFTNTLMTGAGSWQPVLDQHIQQMTSSSVTKATVLTGDTWPKATKSTDVSTLPTGTDPKYSVPSGVGTVGTGAPITDRGSSAGVSVDDAAPNATVAPGPALMDYGTSSTPTPYPSSSTGYNA